MGYETHRVSIRVSYANHCIFRVRSASLSEFAANARPRPSVVNPNNEKIAYTFTVEECILAGHDAVVPKCPMHGPLPLSTIAPDTVIVTILFSDY